MVRNHGHAQWIQDRIQIHRSSSDTPHPQEKMCTLWLQHRGQVLNILEDYVTSTIIKIALVRQVL